MAILPLIIDTDFALSEDATAELCRRINQILCEPPPALFFVQVRIIPASIDDIGMVVGDIYRVTLCGVGGVALPEERKFLLFKKEHNGSLQLRYIAK
jgi:hypothetical protein